MNSFAELYVLPGEAYSQKRVKEFDVPDNRWRVYDYADLIARVKASLDIFWLKDDALADSAILPPPDAIAQEIVATLVVSISLVATIPITTALAAWLAGPRPSATPEPPRRAVDEVVG